MALQKPLELEGWGFAHADHTKAHCGGHVRGWSRPAISLPSATQDDQSHNPPRCQPTKKGRACVPGRTGRHVGEEGDWGELGGLRSILYRISACGRPGTQSLRANYWGDLDSTRPAPELGTIKPTIRERKAREGERAAMLSAIYKATARASRVINIISWMLSS